MNSPGIDDSKFGDDGVQTDDVSGRWIRDQLRAVADDPSDNSSVSALEQATAEALGNTDSETTVEELEICEIGAMVA